MLRPLILGRAGTPDHEEAVAAYVFSATLAIQDITGSETSGVTASHVLKRLESSVESRAFLFALSRRTTPRPLGALGYPELAADDLLDVEAWVFVSLPLLEDLSVIEAHVTLDASIAPLPGEEIPAEPWNEALSLVDALSTALSRPIRHIWVTSSPSGTAPDALVSSGYERAFAETQAEFEIPATTQTADVVENFSFMPRDLEDVVTILRSSSRNYPRGSLRIDTVDWTAQRFRDASARLIDRGGTQLTALARDNDGRAVGMAEIVHFDADAENLCELGLVYVLAQHRRKGHATSLIRSALAAAREAWPKVDTCYISYPTGDPASTAIAEALGAETMSVTAAWQKLGQPRTSVDEDE